MDSVLEATDARGVTTLTLNRPARHNALDDALIAELTTALDRVGTNPETRIVVLASNGRSFCAGADLDWMRRKADASEEENRTDAAALAQLLHVLDTLPKPTVALVHGNAYGGGVGIAACCDIALAAETATFALTEVKLGITPATISPYIVRAIGPKQARRYFLTAETFTARRAWEMGLVHEAVSAEELHAARDLIIEALLQGALSAQGAAKSLVSLCEGEPINEALRLETSRRIAAARASQEGREGIRAFLEKRPPSWRVT